MTRKVSYSWRLPEVMAVRGIVGRTELVWLLKQRNIHLSTSQVDRLLATTPQWLSMRLLAALCDVLHCTPADLIVTTTTDNRPTPSSTVTPPHGSGKTRR